MLSAMNDVIALFTFASRTVVRLCLDNIGSLYSKCENPRREGKKCKITFSAIAYTVANGATEKVSGMTLASTTRRLAVRCTLKSGATTPSRVRNE
jgi:hypothetical protein